MIGLTQKVIATCKHLPAAWGPFFQLGKLLTSVKTKVTFVFGDSFSVWCCLPTVPTAIALPHNACFLSHSCNSTVGLSLSPPAPSYLSSLLPKLITSPHKIKIFLIFY